MFVVCFLEIAQYESRVKQIFIASVQTPSTLEDVQYTRASIELEGNMEHARELVSKDEQRDALAKAIFNKRGITEEATAQSNVRLQQLVQQKRTLETLVKTFVERNGNDEIRSKMSSPYKTASRHDNEKEMEKLLHHASNDKYFPVDTICPHLGLKKEPYIKLKNSVPKNKYCIHRQPSLEECQKATRYYQVDSPPLRCDEQTEKDLCTINNKWRSSIKELVKIRCDVGRCGNNPIYVASMDPSTGKLEDQQKWHKFDSKTELENNLPSVVIQNSQNGFHFCLVQCLRNNTSRIIRTVLVFPPVLGVTKSRGTKSKSLNLNVVVLSSVSRAHFYRSLPETVATLRNIVYDNSKTASALDFESVQSFGSDTAQNLRYLLSRQNGKSSSQNSEVSSLFTELKKLGYQNVLQTDLCWHDKGAFTSEGGMQSKLETEGTREEFREEWKYLQPMTTKHIDDAGMTYLGCEVSSESGVPNQPDDPKASCLNGRYRFTYIFEYIDKIQHALKASKIKTPFFSYTYLNFTRDDLGIGIKQIDQQLSTFLNNMAHEENTVTLLTSEHGPTTTKYSIDSVEGRYEIYNPILFMIIPKGVAAKFGKQQMEALVKNQHRLTSLADIYNTLVSIGNLAENHLEARPDRGLLAEIPENRTCADIGVQVGSLCKCPGWEKWFPDDDPRFTWIAEYALGELNNRLQYSIQTLTYLNAGNDKCQRLVGCAFEKIYRGREHNTLSLDLIVHPGRQVFETQVQLPKHFYQKPPSQTTDEFVKVLRFRKAGLKALSNSDSSIPIDLCLNGFHVLKNKTRTKINLRAVDGKYNEGVLEMAHRANHFGSRPRIQVLDRRHKCLLLITRAHSRDTLAFEVSNICVDRSFVIKVDMTNRGEGHAFLTVRLPMIVQLSPGTHRFLLSAYQPRGVINLKPKIAFKVVF